MNIVRSKKLKFRPLVILTLVIAGSLTAGFVFAQYDYYDPYSNSNIDYFPMNPVNTSPSRTGGTSGGTTSKSTTPGTATSSGTTTTTTTTACSNKPEANPQNTRSVEIRESSGKVFYLSPPKEAVADARAYPESSQTIFKIIYGPTGMQTDEIKIGLITIDNKCYPKYGYIQDPSQGASASPPSKPVATDSTGVPEDKTAARLDPATGKVYNYKTEALIEDARYDAAARVIYYKDTNSTFGTVLTDTYGYVNIDVRGMVDHPSADVSPPPSVPLKSVKFRDIPESDHYVTALVDYMLQKKTYTVPKGKIFGANKTVKGSFALQVLAAVSGKGCGSEAKYPGAKKCKEYLVKNGVVDENFSLNGKITRGDFYASLLKIQNIPLEDASEDDLRALCSDVLEPTKYAAQILVTASKHRILEKHNGECRPLKTFSQKEAAQFAIRALEASANFADE